MDQKEFNILLDKYLQGTCTEEERRLLDKFYDSYEGDEQVLPPGKKELIKETIHGKIKARIRAEEQENKVMPQRTTMPFMKIAASIVLLMSVGVLLYLNFLSPGVQTMAMVELTTQPGETRSITLADGTKITLNAASTLTYPESFGDDSRKVTLDGEAFFDVARDESRPFSIASQGLSTTVLGTSFNIKAYKEEPVVVSVSTGKVQVADNRHKVLLKPNEQVIYDLGTRALTKSAIDAAATRRWMEGIIEFKNTPLDEAAKVLSRQFNVSITFENKALQQCTISGKYVNETLTNILESIKFIKKIEYRFEGKNKVVLNGNACL